MTSIAVQAKVDVIRTARVQQVESMFDVPIAERHVVDVTHELPLDERDWHVGLIVGPSGAGKSLLARHAWPDLVLEHLAWPRDRAIIDAFPDDVETGEVVAMFGAVGLQSPPAWLRPHHTLSNGEQFRATMARVLCEHPQLAVVDEFTSVVDRHVAHVVSATVAKHVRRNGARFVAVTCHFDVEDWLQPDWVYRPDLRTFSWRSLQPRPTFDLVIAPVDRAAWRAFAPYHYLSSDLLTASQCFGAWVDGMLVGFIAVIRQPHAHAKNLRRIHRTVVVPDWQGLGIAQHLYSTLGAYYWERGDRLRGTTAHPAAIASHRKAGWRDVTPKVSMRTGPRSMMSESNRQLRRFNTRTFEYVHGVSS